MATWKLCGLTKMSKASSYTPSCGVFDFASYTASLHSTLFTSSWENCPEWSLWCWVSLSLESTGLVLSGAVNREVERGGFISSHVYLCQFFPLQVSLFSPEGAATSVPTQVKFLACQDNMV